MKIFSGGKLNAASARNCFLVNQFATPGLGSLMGGRFAAGSGQLALALIAAGMILYWFFNTMRQYYSLLNADSTYVSYAKWGIAGGCFLIASWLWSLLTSISMIRQAKEEEPPKGPGSIPPRIRNVPPKI